MTLGNAERPMANRVASFLLAAVVAACVSQPNAAASLEISTRPVSSPRADEAEVCNQALLGPVIIGRKGDVLIFSSVDTSREVELVWPHGFSARVIAGKGELVDSLGVVVGREGDTLSNLGGAGGDVCSIGTDHDSDQAPGVAAPRAT
jgi:hypothetical protein